MYLPLALSRNQYLVAYYLQREDNMYSKYPLILVLNFSMSFNIYA